MESLLKQRTKNRVPTFDFITFNIYESFSRHQRDLWTFSVGYEKNILDLAMNGTILTLVMNGTNLSEEHFETLSNATRG